MRSTTLTARLRRLATITACLAAGPLPAATSGLFTYTDNGEDVTITDYPDDAAGPVTIPSKIAGKPVTGISSYAFYGCAGLTSVSIPASVNNIGSFAFTACPALTSFSLDSSNSTYSTQGGVVFNKTKSSLQFYPCGKSGAYSVPAGVTTIADNSFYGCHGLTTVTFPDSVTTIGPGAFYECTGLTTVSVPAGVTGIGDFAFTACTGLGTIAVDSGNDNYSSSGGVLLNKNKSIILQYPGGKTGAYTIPATVNHVAPNAFYGCNNLTGVTFPTSVATIGSQAFYGCGGLETVTLPEGVASIGTYAFGSCGALTRISLPVSLTVIESSAFHSCKGLTTVGIPAGVTTIGNGVFNNCGMLKSIVVDEANPDYSSAGGVLFNKTKTTLLACPAGRAGNYEIPVSVTAIGDLAFSNCTAITETTIPAKVASVGNYAFYGCTGLAQVTFIGDAPTIGINVFDFCASNFHIRYIDGKTGYTSPTWLGFPCEGVPPLPEIDIRNPVATSLVDGMSTRSFGKMKVGLTSTNKTFTIRNTGAAVLNNLSVRIKGANPLNFTVTQPLRTSLPPGASTTFKVAFKPNRTGLRQGLILVSNNDADERPFDIRVTGTGTAP